MTNQCWSTLTLKSFTLIGSKFMIYTSKFWNHFHSRFSESQSHSTYSSITLMEKKNSSPSIFKVMQNGTKRELKYLTQFKQSYLWGRMVWICWNIIFFFHSWLFASFGFSPIWFLSSQKPRKKGQDITESTNTENFLVFIISCCNFNCASPRDFHSRNRERKIDWRALVVQSISTHSHHIARFSLNICIKIESLPKRVLTQSFHHWLRRVMNKSRMEAKHNESFRT